MKKIIIVPDEMYTKACTEIVLSATKYGLIYTSVPINVY